MKKKKKYEAPNEYRVLYRHRKEITEQYHYYNCYSKEEALDTFEKIAKQRHWDDLRVIHVELYDRWHGTWTIMPDDKPQT